MPLLDVVMLVGGLIAAVTFVLLWRRYPRRRKLLLAGAVLGAGLAAYAVWWFMFRVDDPTFERDRDQAHDAQKILDDALGADF